MADLEKKSSTFIEELSQYSKSNVKCSDCKKKMEKILELLYNLPPKESCMEAGICEHCKETAYSCKQCEMLVKIIDKNKINEYRKIERRFSEWVTKIRNSLRELIECKSLCTHGTLEQPTTHFLRFLEPAASKRYLNIVTFPPRAHINLTSDDVTEKHGIKTGTTLSLPDKLTEESEFSEKRGVTPASLETMIKEWQTKQRSFSRRGVIDKKTKEQNYEEGSEARDNDTQEHFFNIKFAADTSSDMITRKKDVKELKLGQKRIPRTLLDVSTVDNVDNTKEHYLKRRFVADPSLDMMTRRSIDIKELDFGRITIPRAFPDSFSKNKGTDQRDLAVTVNVMSENSFIYKDIDKHVLKEMLAFRDKKIEDQHTKEYNIDKSGIIGVLQEKMIRNKDQEKYHKFGKSVDDTSPHMVSLINDKLDWGLGQISLPQASLDNLITYQNSKDRDLGERSISWLKNLTEAEKHDLGRKSVTHESFVNLSKDKQTEKHEFDTTDFIDTLLDNQTVWFKDTEELEFYDKGITYDLLENLPHNEEINNDIEKNVFEKRGLSWLVNLNKNRNKVYDLNMTSKTDSSLHMLNRGIDTKKRHLSSTSVLLALSDNPIKDIEEPYLETLDGTDDNPMIQSDSTGSYSLLEKLTKKQSLSKKSVTYASVDILASYKQLEVKDFKSTSQAISENIAKKINTNMHLNHALQDKEEQDFGIKSPINFSSNSIAIDMEEPNFASSESIPVKLDNLIKTNDIEDKKELDYGKTSTNQGFQEDMDSEYGVTHGIKEDVFTQDKPIHKAKEIDGNISEKGRRVSSRKSKTKSNGNNDHDKKDTPESKGAKQKTVLIITSSSKKLNTKPSESQTTRKSSFDYQKLLVGSKENTENRKKSIQNEGKDKKIKKDEGEFIKEKYYTEQEEGKSSFDEDTTSKRKKSYKFSTSEEVKKDANEQMEISMKKSIEALKKTSMTNQNQKESKHKKKVQILHSEEKMYHRMQSGMHDRLTLRQVLLNKDKNAKIVITPQKPIKKSISLLPDSVRLESYRHKQKEIEISGEPASITDTGEVIVECEDAQVVSEAMIKGDAIVPHDPVFKYKLQEAAKPLLYRVHTTLPPDITFKRPSSYIFGQDEEIKSDKIVTTRYALSDKKYIQKGWTQLPSIKTMRQVIIYRMAPVQPELNWFLRNKENKTVFYDTGEILADIDKHGYGKLFYKNGLVALDYFKESGGKFKYMIYSDQFDQNSRTLSPPILLAWFDHLGNALINDQSGKLRLQYNQFEGCVTDKKIGPPCKWNWHNLNEPPALENTATEQYEEIDQFVKDLNRHSHVSRTSPGGRSSHSISHTSSTRMRTEEEEKAANREYQAMINLEVINLLKRQKKRVYRSLLIKSKTVKISNSWSLYVIDQEHVYLRFRNEGASLKFNMGLKLMSNHVLGLTKVEFSDTVVSVLAVPEHILP